MHRTRDLKQTFIDTSHRPPYIVLQIRHGTLSTHPTRLPHCIVLMYPVDLYSLVYNYIIMLSPVFEWDISYDYMQYSNWYRHLTVLEIMCTFSDILKTHIFNLHFIRHFRAQLPQFIILLLASRIVRCYCISVNIHV